MPRKGKDVGIRQRPNRSWEAKQGASLAIIGKSLGHRSQAATAIYARLEQDPVRASIQLAADAIMGAAGTQGKEGDVIPFPRPEDEEQTG